VEVTALGGLAQASAKNTKCFPTYALKLDKYPKGSDLPGKQEVCATRSYFHKGIQ